MPRSRAQRIAVAWIGLSITAAAFVGSGFAANGRIPSITIDATEAARLQEQLGRWQRNLLDSGLGRACLTETGEEIGWLMSPPLNGYYWGYRATKDQRWIVAMIACADAWLRRAVVEPDGFIGWPKLGAAGNPVDNLDSYVADSLLGEAMALRPIVLLSAEILADRGLANLYGQKAAHYIEVATALFRKWDQRGAWRAVEGGTVAMILPYGIDKSSGGWTANYARRFDPHLGFTLQDNKQNLVASWLLAMAQATGDTSYRQRASAWFAVMKSRMHPEGDGTIKIWNYWEPAGPWDYKDDGTPKHWIGVHPNAGYYVIDVEAITLAYQSRLVFDDADIAALVSTSVADGRLWPALAPYDARIRKRFVDSINPTGWSEIELLPWYAFLTGRSKTGDSRAQ